MQRPWRSIRAAARVEARCCGRRCAMQVEIVDGVTAPKAA
jgi:hypothetical protein